MYPKKLTPRQRRLVAFSKLQEDCVRNPGTVWGSLCEIDYRTKVGSDAWYARHVPRLRRLSAWRRMHMLSQHDGVRDLRYGHRMRDWLRWIKRKEADVDTTIE